MAKIEGVELLFGHEVTGLAHDEDQVAVEAPCAGEVTTLKGDILIGCDGGRSSGAQAARHCVRGLYLSGIFPRRRDAVRFPRPHARHLLRQLYGGPGEWYLLLQIPDMWRVVLPAEENVSPDDAVSERSLQASLQNILPRADDYEIAVRAVYRVHQRVAERYRSGRVFLAGDAAHLNNPLGGMGLNGGLHDAISLCDRLAQVWRGDADETILDGYEAQRRPEAIGAIHAITERNKRLLEERDPVVRKRNLDELRQIAADPARHYQYLLDAAMISSLRRGSAMLTRNFPFRRRKADII